MTITYGKPATGPREEAHSRALTLRQLCDKGDFSFHLNIRTDFSDMARHGSELVLCDAQDGVTIHLDMASELEAERALHQLRDQHQNDPKGLFFMLACPEALSAEMNGCSDNQEHIPAYTGTHYRR